MFSALRASVWSTNKGEPAPGPLPWIRHWFQPLLKETKRLYGGWGHGPQGPVVRRPISTNPGLNFNPGLFLFSSKAFSRTIFSILFRVANHQILEKKNWTEFAFSHLNSNFEPTQKVCQNLSITISNILTCSVGLVSGRLYEIPSDRKKKEKEKTTKDYQLFSLFSEFNDKSGESDKKNRKSGRQHDK